MISLLVHQVQLNKNQIKVTKLKRLVIFGLCSALAFAKVHYAKVEPYDTITLKSSVSGLVTQAKIELEGRVVDNQRVIHIDDKLDIINLSQTQKSIDLIKDMIDINKEIKATLAKSVSRQKGYYERISKLSTASKTQKDNAYIAYSSAKTQYLNINEKILSLQKQLLDLNYLQSKLQDSIEKKSITLHHQYLYKLLVKKGNFVTPATPLAIVDDISKAKLTLYLDSDELEGIEDKTIYIDDNKTNYHINKIWKVSDEQFVSSYKVEIAINPPKKRFSKLLKVEFR
jgi:multidrug resistance efflux pump